MFREMVPVVVEKGIQTRAGVREEVGEWLGVVLLQGEAVGAPPPSRAVLWMKGRTGILSTVVVRTVVMMLVAA